MRKWKWIATNCHSINHISQILRASGSDTELNYELIWTVKELQMALCSVQNILKFNMNYDSLFGIST